MSAHPPVCNHRIYEVLIVFMASVIAGLLGGIIMVALGATLLAAVGAGGVVLAAVFTLGMTAVAYIKNHGS